MKRIHLQRTIEVGCWRVIGQVAKSSKRPELMPVLLRARERGATDPDDVAGHLLFEPRSRLVVAERLLQIAELYGLLEQRDRRYSLTEPGHAALATMQVFVPEQGAWTVWASNDPLLPTPILHVEPWVESTAHDEIRGNGRDTARERPFERLPQWVRDAAGVVAAPLISGERRRVDELEAEGEVADPETTLRAAWDVSGARLWVEGTLGGEPVSAALDAPDVGVDAVWDQLLQVEGLWTRWDASANALRVGFAEATPAERESLVCAVTFQRPAIASLGAFDAATVEGIALRAPTAEDAKRWTEWRLRARVRDYATAERFSAWTAEAVAPFSEFDSSPPTRRALAEAAWRERTARPTPYAWHLVAAEDWSL